MTNSTSEGRGRSRIAASATRALLLASLFLLAFSALASSASARTETLRWRAGTGNGDPATGYVFYAGASADAFVVSQDVGNAGGPGPDGIYSYTWTIDHPALDTIDIHVAVKAYDADGELSSLSNGIVRAAPVQEVNDAPNGTIVSPAGNLTINEGGTVTFGGSVSDPNGDSVSAVWNFDFANSGLGSSSAVSPGARTFDRAGTFVVRMTARDQHGLADPTPDAVTITVVGAGPPPPPLPEPEPEPTPEGPGIQAAALGAGDAVMVTAPEGDPRLFVVQRNGVIRIAEGGAVRPRAFLDLRDDVSSGEGEGLLGMAFDPEFGENGYFFYTFRVDRAGNSVVSRFRLSLGNPYTAERESEEVILAVEQPRSGNNGGHIAFGPDGFLYIGLGDGGGSHDPDELSQDGGSLLGKILRIDVGRPFANGSAAVEDSPYGIPSDNPFVGQGSIHDEIWALGLRNPSRFSFDRQTGALWIADQGEDFEEELNFEPAGDRGGRNYGWDVVEGTICNDVDPDPGLSCASNQITDPVYEYEQTASDCDIVGGYVYRGVISDFHGEYFFADACSGRIWSRDVSSGQVTDRTAQFSAWVEGGEVDVVGLGEDGVGELYLVAAGGKIYELRAEEPECNDGFDNDGDGLFDYPEDPGCARASSTTEQPLCDDGMDNDQDGQIDIADPQCRSTWENIEATPSASTGDLISESLCGLGAEIAFLLPGAMWLRARRRTSRRRRQAQA